MDKMLRLCLSQWCFNTEIEPIRRSHFCFNFHFSWKKNLQRQRTENPSQSKKKRKEKNPRFCLVRVQFYHYLIVPDTPQVECFHIAALHCTYCQSPDSSEKKLHFLEGA